MTIFFDWKVKSLILVLSRGDQVVSDLCKSRRNRNKRSRRGKLYQQFINALSIRLDEVKRKKITFLSHSTLRFQENPV